MPSRNLFYLAFLIWGIIFAGSFVNFALTQVSGDGFTRGLGRITAFIGWQAAATVPAVGLFFQARRFLDQPVMRWLGRIPLILAGLFFAGLFGTIAWAVLSKPDPSEAILTGPATTAPVTTAPSD